MFFLAVVALASWPAVPRAANALPDAGDPAENVWTLHWIADAALHHPAQLYAAPIFHGFPNALAYDDTSLLPGLLLAPLWLSGQILLFYNVLMWVTLALLGFTAYLLIRALSGSFLAGIVGGLVCAINSYNLAHLSHMNVLSAYLLPLALLALHRLFHPGPAGPRWTAVLGVGLAIVGQLLSTFYIFIYLLIAVGGYLAWQALGRRAVWGWPATWRRRLGVQLALLGLVSAGATGLVAAPYLQTQQVMGFARTSAENQSWAAHPVDYLSVSLHNRAYARQLPHNDPEPLFAGLGALGLASAGLLAVARRRGRPLPPTKTPPAPVRDAADIGFYALLLLGGLLLTLGPTLDIGPVSIPLPYRLVAWLPGGAALRAPVRAMVLVNLGLGVFAGLGARRILGRLLAPPWAPSPPARRAAIARTLVGGLVLAVLVALVLVEQQVAPLPLVTMPAGAAGMPPVYRWLAAHHDDGVLVELPAGLGLRDPTVESRHMYYQIAHGHPLISGYSSFLPPTYVEIMSRLAADSTHFTAEQLGLLQSLDVRYILYHDVNYKTRDWRQLAADLGQAAQVREIGTFPSRTYGGDHLYQLDPRPSSAVLRIAVLVDPATPGTATVQITNPYTYPLLSRLRPTLDLITGDGQHLAVPTPLVLAPGGYTFHVPLASMPTDAGMAWTPEAPAPGYLEIATTGARRP